eukprot:182367_1
MTCPANPDIIQVPWEFIEGEEAPKVQKFGSDDGENATFRIKGEDHTLGNALRWMLATSNPKTVDLAAYTIPHPHSDAMNVRIQTKNHADATEVLIESAKKIQNLCDYVDDVYGKALVKYNKSKQKKSKKRKVKTEQKTDNDSMDEDQDSDV